MKNEFSTLDVIKILGITRNRIREWLREGYVWPSISESSGQGVKNVFSRWDLYAIELFKRLISTGMNRWEAHRFLHGWDMKTRKLTLEDRNEIKKYVVIIFEKKDQICLHPEFINTGKIDEIFNNFPTWDTMIVFNMGKIIDYVDSKAP
ncbi:MerR family transcriptional regulator [Candidatus Latescibacterota bacterium]